VFRRIVRLVFFAAIATGAGVALAKFVQSRRSAQELPRGDWLPPKRPETPLVEPEMLHGVSLKKEPPPAEETDADGADDEAAREAAPAWLEPEADGS
jgi:hypothetical protein